MEGESLLIGGEVAAVAGDRHPLSVLDGSNNRTRRVV